MEKQETDAQEERKKFLLLDKKSFATSYSQTFFVNLDNVEHSPTLPEVLCKEGVLKSFEKFTRKHLCWNLFLEALFKINSSNSVFF